MQPTSYVALLLAATLLPAPSSASAQASFEGVITFAFHGENGKTGRIVQTSKPHKMRSDMTSEAGQVSTIIDGDAGRMIMVMHAQKRYMLYTKEDMQRMGQAMMGFADAVHEIAPHDSARPPRPEGKLTNTGRTEVVAGVPCEVWAYEGSKNGQPQRGEGCFAKGLGLGSLMSALGGPMGVGGGVGARRRPQDWGPATALLAQGYGVLKISEEKNGSLKTVIEVTKIERRPVSDAEFAPPAGYQEMRVGDMMRARPSH